MKKRVEKETTQRRDILNRVPRIILGVLLIVIGILCFTNGDPLSRYLKWVSVYIFGVLFFVMGFAFMGAGVYFLVVPREKGKRKINWLDLLAMFLAFFSLSVLISSSEAFRDLTTPSFTSTYSNLMSQSSPNGFYVELPDRISLVGGGFFATLFVSFGNSMGMGLVGTRVIYWIVLLLSLIFLLRYPALTMSKAVVRIKEEQKRSRFDAPEVTRKEEPKREGIHTPSEEVVQATPKTNASYNFPSANESYVLEDYATPKPATSKKPYRSNVDSSKVENTSQNSMVQDVGPIFGKVESNKPRSFPQEDTYAPNTSTKYKNNPERKEEVHAVTTKPQLPREETSVIREMDETPIEEVKRFEPKVEEVNLSTIKTVEVHDKKEQKVEDVSPVPVRKEEPKIKETASKVEHVAPTSAQENNDAYQQPTPVEPKPISSNNASYAYAKPVIEEVRLPPKVINTDGFTSLQTDEQIREDQKKAEINLSNRKPIETKTTSFALPKIMEEDKSGPEPYREVDNDPKPIEKIVPIQPIVYTSSKKYVLPDDSLLKDYDNTQALEEIQRKALDIGYQLNKFFKEFGIKAHSENYNIGASVTCFHIHLEPGLKMASIENVLPNLSVALNGNSSVRFLKVIPGKNFSGIEVGNPISMTVAFKECYDYLMNMDPKCKMKLLFPLGQDVFGNIKVAQLDKLPHLLVAGSTGSGKSVFVHSIILSMIMRTYPNEVKFMLIDPKKVEFAKYADMPHLFCPIITETDQAEVALNKMVVEMDRRFELFRKAQVVNFEQYNEYCKSHSSAEKFPLVVVIIDEFADLMSSASDGSAAVNVGRLAAKARASGIHLIVATQRPSTNVISGDIKNNIPARISLLVSSSTDSRVILDDMGAENLVGRGDLLAKIPGSKETLRCQSPFVSENEISAVLDYLKARAKPVYNPDFIALDAVPAADDYSGEAGAANILERVKNDPLYEKAKEIVADSRKASANFLSKAMNISYLKASNYLDAMDSEGYTKRYANGRRVLASDLENTDD